MGNIEISGSGHILEGCIDRNSMTCLNDLQPTYRHSDSIIDLFLVNTEMVKDVIFCQTLTHTTVRSDHFGILLEIFESTSSDEVTFIEKYNLDQADWERLKEQTDQMFQNWLNHSEIHSDVDEMFSSFLVFAQNAWMNVSPKSK